jgi:hypothetical protein
MSIITCLAFATNIPTFTLLFLLFFSHLALPGNVVVLACAAADVDRVIASVVAVVGWTHDAATARRECPVTSKHKILGDVRRSPPS